MKKDHSKENITTKYIEYKYKNTGIRNLFAYPNYRVLFIHEMLKNSIIETFFWIFC